MALEMTSVESDRTSQIGQENPIIAAAQMDFRGGERGAPGGLVDIEIGNRPNSEATEGASEREKAARYTPHV